MIFHFARSSYRHALLRAVRAAASAVVQCVVSTSSWRARGLVSASMAQQIVGRVLDLV